MTTRRWMLLLGLATAVAACSSAPSDSSTPRSNAWRGDFDRDLEVAVTSTDVAVGDELEFTFTNRGEVSVSTGVLGCVNRYERDEGGTWRTIEHLRNCIQSEMIHRAGQTSTYRTPAPDAPGTYRLLINASYAGTVLGVRSAPFEVAPRP